MKKSIRYFTFLALIAGLLFTSCVSNKKFTASETRANKLNNENADNLSKLNDCNNLVTTMNVDKASLQKQNEAALKEYSSMQSDLLLIATQSKMTIADQAKGKAALKTLADVLNSSKDFTVAIEGHTDDIPIKTRVFEDNWDLSTARASSIVRVLTKDNGFDSGRITASGKSEFHPIGVNTTAEGRANNRRTEVILSPDLQEIYKLLYQ